MDKSSNCHDFLQNIIPRDLKTRLASNKVDDESVRFSFFPDMRYGYRNNANTSENCEFPWNCSIFRKRENVSP